MYIVKPIEEAVSITSSHYVNVGTLSIGDCIKDDDEDVCYTITDISKGIGGGAYYDSNDRVIVED